MAKRFDLRTFAIIFGAAALGAVWANYNRELAPTLTTLESYQPRVWAIFATPLALLIGWLLARRQDAWLAVFVCFCIYFFSPFVAARYESCAVLTGSFSLANCFAPTDDYQFAARNSGHAIYFGAVIVIHMLAALAVALRQALRSSTMPEQTSPIQQSEARS